jgi:hypothetical protein
MKKNLIFLLPLLLIGCEKEFDNVIEVKQSSYQVTATSSFSSFNYTSEDSAVTVWLQVNSKENIQSIFFDIYSPDNKKLNSSPVQLFDSGRPEHGDAAANDNRFSNRIIFSNQDANGKYEIQFFIRDNSGNTKKVAFHHFMFDNGQANVPPVISDLVITPDTVVVADSAEVIHLSIKAHDDNGLNDIETVFFIVYRPDGTTNGIRVPLFDDGNLIDHGDETAGDGIYSLLIKIEPHNMKGTYQFEFQARDRRKEYSNKITHPIVVL